MPTSLTSRLRLTLPDTESIGAVNIYNDAFSVVEAHLNIHFTDVNLTAQPPAADNVGKSYVVPPIGATGGWEIYAGHGVYSDGFSWIPLRTYGDVNNVLEGLTASVKGSFGPDAVWSGSAWVYLPVRPIPTDTDSVSVGIGSGPISFAIGSVLMAGTAYKNASAYTQNDFVFEHYFRGKIEKFLGSEGAKEYKGLPVLTELEKFLKKHWHLPGVSRESSGVFSRADMMLKEVEEIHLHFIGINDRINRLENMK